MDEDPSTAWHPLGTPTRRSVHGQHRNRQRRARRCLGARLAALAVATVLVAACAAPGAVSTPSPSAARPPRPTAAAPSASSQASTAPSASAVAAGPSCGTDPVELNAYFETGFDLPFKLSDEFTKQFPNVTWKISQDQFTNLMNATPRLLSGDNPARPHPAAVDGVAGQGRAAQEPRRLRDRIRLGQVARRHSSRRTGSGPTARAGPARCTRWA